MNTQELQIEILGKEIEFEVEFNFTKGEPRITHLLPENCQEGSPDEYELIKLYIVSYENDQKVFNDCSYLLNELSEVIIEQLEEIRNE